MQGSSLRSYRLLGPHVFKFGAELLSTQYFLSSPCSRAPCTEHVSGSLTIRKYYSMNKGCQAWAGKLEMDGGCDGP
jgi:hypothetical protein